MQILHSSSRYFGSQFRPVEQAAQVTTVWGTASARATSALQQQHLRSNFCPRFLQELHHILIQCEWREWPLFFLAASMGAVLGALCAPWLRSFRSFGGAQGCHSLHTLSLPRVAPAGHLLVTEGWWHRPCPTPHDGALQGTAKGTGAKWLSQSLSCHNDQNCKGEVFHGGWS